MFDIAWDPFGVDSFTILVGICASAFNIPTRYLRGHKPYISRQRLVTDILNGVTLVPFALMLFSAFSKEILASLIHTNIVLVGVAGAIGLVFTLGEILKE